MASYYSGNNVGAIVADVGSYATKIGWAGDDYPKSYFRSTVAVTRNTTQGNNNKTTTIDQINYDFYTRHIQHPEYSDGDYTVANPVDPTTGLWIDPHGSDWYQLIQHFIRHGYHTALGTPVEEHPLILVERSYNPPPIRQQTMECVFEELNVPATYLGKDAVFSCFAVGKTSATVIDVGYSGTTVTPVFEGYVEQKGIRRCPVGLYEVDEFILEQLDSLLGRPVQPLYQVRTRTLRAPDFHNAARRFLAQECRLSGAGAALNMAPTGFHAPNKSFELPDRTLIDIPSAHRFAAADLLIADSRREEVTKKYKEQWQRMVEDFSKLESDNETFSDAAAVGISKRRAPRKAFSYQNLNKAVAQYLSTDLLTASSIPNMVCDAAYRCDRDQQATLLGNVVLGGGGACMGPTEQAMPDVLREQLEALIHQHTPNWRVKLSSPGVTERSVLPWLGGSILGSMGSFHEMFITREEYDEWGPAIVNRKCP